MNEKKCPYCGEMIKAEAQKCRYCGEWLESAKKEMIISIMSSLQSHAQHDGESIEQSISTNNSSVEEYKKMYQSFKEKLSEKQHQLNDKLEDLKDAIFNELVVLKKVSNQKDAFYVENRALDFFKRMKLEEKVNLCPEEEVIFIRDASFFNDLSSGLVITNQGIHIIDNQDKLVWAAIHRVVRDDDCYVFMMKSGQREKLYTSYFCKEHVPESYLVGKVLEAMNKTIIYYSDLAGLQSIVSTYQNNFEQIKHLFQSEYPNEYQDFLNSITDTVSEKDVVAALAPYIKANNFISIRRTPYLNKEGDDTKISIAQFVDENEDEICTDMLADLVKYEQIANSILELTAKASEKCKEMQAAVSNVSEKLLEVGLKNMVGKNRKMGKYALIGAAALEVSNFAYGIWSDYQSEKEERERKKLLLRFKQKVAEEKYVFTAKTLVEMTQKMGRYEQLYLSEFQKKIDPSQDFIDKRVMIFHRSFSVYVKMEYIRRVLAFIVSEMRAWKSGMNESSENLPDLDYILEYEIQNWPQRLMNKNTNVSLCEWEDYLLDYLINNHRDGSGIPVPVYLLFSSPYLLRNYVGLSSEMLRETPDMSLLERTDCNFFDTFRKQFLIEDLKESTDEKMQAKVSDVKSPISSTMWKVLMSNSYYKDFQKYRRECSFEFTGMGCLMMLAIFFLTIYWIIPGLALWWYWKKYMREKQYDKELEEWREKIRTNEIELAKKYNKF